MVWLVSSLYLIAVVLVVRRPGYRRLARGVAHTVAARFGVPEARLGLWLLAGVASALALAGEVYLVGQIRASGLTASSAALAAGLALAALPAVAIALALGIPALLLETLGLGFVWRLTAFALALLLPGVVLVVLDGAWRRRAAPPSGRAPPPGELARRHGAFGGQELRRLTNERRRLDTVRRVMKAENELMKTILENRRLRDKLSD